MAHTFHVALYVRSIPEAVEQYRRVLGVEPAKVKHDYAKFELEDPPVILSLNAGGEPGKLSHLGIRYEGTVIRRRRGRARKQRQIAQAGVEHVGERSAHADVEVMALMTAACEHAGLSDFTLELSQVAIGHALLRDLGPSALRAATGHMGRKDTTQLEQVLRAAGTSARERKRMIALSELHGDVSTLKRAEKLVAGTAAEKPLRALQRVVAGLEERGLGERLGVDLGEVRGGAYYTGTSFQLLAAGPGEAVAAGADDVAEDAVHDGGSSPYSLIFS